MRFAILPRAAVPLAAGIVAASTLAAESDYSSLCGAVDRKSPLVIPEQTQAVLEAGRATAGASATADALLDRAAREIAHAADDDAACSEVLTSGDALFQKVLGLNRKSVARAGGYRRAKDSDRRSVQKTITRHWRADQAARATYVALQTEDREGAAYWAQRRATAHSIVVDGEARQALTDILERYDWIDAERFGSKVSQHAWLLVQHADDDVAFQADVLSRMEPYLESGDIKPANYAYLYDRVAINRGTPQRYGTQPVWECEDGKLSLQPIEDALNVDERREALGMGTAEDQRREMQSWFCR
jgi:hypothetical protein